MSRSNLAATLFLAVLGGVLVGCGVRTETAQVATEPAPLPHERMVDPPADPNKDKKEIVDAAVSEHTINQATQALREKLTNEDARLQSDLLKRGAGSITDAAPVTNPTPTSAIPAPPLPEPVVAARDGIIRENKNLEALAGRSGATSNRLLREGGGAGDVKPVDGFVQVPPPAADPTSAESYNLYKENEYRSPLVAAMSTFSADVNTASFSNVRRFLSQGQLPPKDAVFLAEFVNYFPYEYVKPKGNDPIAFNLELGPCPWNRKHHLVRVGVQAQAIDPKEMPPRKLTFLIDTSGSMSEPNKLPLVKQSLGLLIDQLTEKDTVGIVTYAGTAGVALMPTSGTEKEKIRTAVEGLGAGGSTNGEGGLKAAYELARNSFDEKAVNRVILCTDGDFNVGVSSQGELVRMIETQRKSGVFLTILGYGMGNYKDGTLKELANHGNGHHAYIDTLDEAKKVFVEQGGALVLVAKDVKFQIEFNPARVQAYRLVGYENRLLKDEDFRNDAKDAGDMGSGHQVTVLYEIVPMGVPITLPKVDGTKYVTPAAPNPNAPDEWLTVKMRFKRPDSEKSTDADELAKALKGDAKVKDLSADFEFAAAAASFGMLLRDSEFKGGMTFAGVLEMAQGALGTDPGGHRKAFVEIVKQAHELAKPKPAAAAGVGSN